MNESGFASITFIAVFLLILTFTLEIYFIYEAYRAVKVDIDQVLHIALNDSFNKELREGISTINTSEALTLIDQNIQSITESKSYKDYVEVNFTQKNIYSNPASISCEGNLEILPFFTKGFGIENLSIKLPFRSSAFVQIK